MIAHATCTVSLNHGVNACGFEHALGNVGLNLGSEGLNDNQVIVTHAFIVCLNAIAESSAGSLRERLFLKRPTSQNDSNSRYNSRLERGPMASTYNSGVHRFSVFVVLWTVLLFVAGALVTSKDAALSVTDWPTSHGTLVPPLSSLQGGDLFEFSHRAIAGGLGILVLISAVLLWAKESRVWLRWLGIVAVLGVAVQAILGGQVVIRLLHYWLPVIHACFAQIVFGAVLGIAVFTSKWWVSEQPQLEDSGTPSIHSVTILNAAVIYLQVILGAGFRHKEIPIWPHMAGAMLVLGMVIWTA